MALPPPSFSLDLGLVTCSSSLQPDSLDTSAVPSVTSDGSTSSASSGPAVAAAVTVLSGAAAAEGDESGPASTSGSEEDKWWGDSNGSSSNVTRNGAAAPVKLTSAVFILPHPDKVAKGGEDAAFVTADQNVIGVADGVGGWADYGIDAGLFARLILKNIQEAAEAALAVPEGPSPDPMTLLETGYAKMNIKGSSTAVVLVFSPPATLRAVNLGDSGFLLVRGGEGVFQSPSQQHSFNFPYQLSSEVKFSDPTMAADSFELILEAGDIVVTATDGVWDNVYTQDIAQLVTYFRANGRTPAESAMLLGKYAQMRGKDPKYFSPFAQSAYENQLLFMGGKLDDVTVVITYVEPALPSKL